MSRSFPNLSARELWVSAVLIGIAFFAVLSPAIVAGLDWTDDHEIIRRSHGEDLHPQIHNPPEPGIAERTIADFRYGHFRPLYHVLRTARAKMFGANPGIWHASQLALGALTCFLFYWSGRRFGLAILPASLFVAWIILHGDAAEVWFRVGPAETYGLLAMAAGLLLMSWAAEREQSLYFDAAVLACITAMALQKEPFALAIPAMTVLWVGLKRHALDASWPQAARLTALPAIVAGLGCGTVLLTGYLALQQGTYTASVVGRIEAPFSPARWLTVLERPADHFAWYVPVALAVAMLVVRARQGEAWKNQFGAMLVCASVVVLQMPVLHPNWTNSRFFFPAAVGLAGLCAIGLHAMGSIRYLRPAAGIFCIIAAVPAALETHAAAHRFATRTKTFNWMLDRAVEETAPGQSIVIYADPTRFREQIFATVVALGNRGSTSPVFLHPYTAGRPIEAIVSQLATSDLQDWIDVSALSPEIVAGCGDRINRQGDRFVPSGVGTMLIWQNEADYLAHPPPWMPDPEQVLERIDVPTLSAHGFTLKQGPSHKKLVWVRPR